VRFINIPFFENNDGLEKAKQPKYYKQSLYMELVDDAKII